MLDPRIAEVPATFVGLKLPSAIFVLVTLLAASIALVTPPLAMLNVPVPVIGPPVNPEPLPTLVTVPISGTTHTHCEPLHRNIPQTGQLVMRLSLRLPLV